MKERIADAINRAIVEQETSKRALALRLGLKHPQLVRLTNGSNYTIDTLLPVLDALGLEIVIQKKVR